MCAQVNVAWMPSVSLCLFPSFSTCFLGNKCHVTSWDIREYTQKMGMSIEIYSFAFFPFGVCGDRTKWRCFRRHKWTWCCCRPSFELEAFARDLQSLAGSMTLWTRPPSSCSGPHWVDSSGCPLWEPGLVHNTLKTLVVRAFSRTLRCCIICS